VSWRPYLLPLIVLSLAVAMLHDSAPSGAAPLSQATVTSVPGATAVPPAGAPPPTSVFRTPTAVSRLSTPTVTPTLFPGIAPPRSASADLALDFHATSRSPNVVVIGDTLWFTLEVSNLGGTTAPATTIVSQVPPGTTWLPAIEFPTAGYQYCEQNPATREVTCRVSETPSSLAGAAARQVFVFIVRVDAPTGAITNSATLDPTGAVPDANRANNVGSVTVNVLQPSATLAPTSTPTPPLMATVVALQTVVAALQTPSILAAPGNQALSGGSLPPGAFWLRVTTPSEIYSLDMRLVGVAQPGEWYLVFAREGGYALATREGDAPDAFRWISLDPSVQLAETADALVAPPASDQWLAVFTPTETFGMADELLRMAQPGEWYAFVTQQSGWALAVREGDPPDAAVWILLDDRVALASF
jgi:uncharacterized repeat protein (TIGR01451 family)